MKPAETVKGKPMSEQTTAENANANPDNGPVLHKAPDFGNGKYSVTMAECYESLIGNCNVPGPAAEKWARAIGSQLGTLGENIAPTLDTASVSDARGKDKTVTYKEKGGSVKKITETYPLRLFRILGKIRSLAKDDVDGVTVTLPSWVK